MPLYIKTIRYIGCDWRWKSLYCERNKVREFYFLLYPDLWHTSSKNSFHEMSKKYFIIVWVKMITSLHIILSLACLSYRACVVMLFIVYLLEVRNKQLSIMLKYHFLLTCFPLTMLPTQDNITWPTCLPLSKQTWPLECWLCDLSRNGCSLGKLAGMADAALFWGEGQTQQKKSSVKFALTFLLYMLSIFCQICECGERFSVTRNVCCFDMILHSSSKSISSSQTPDPCHTLSKLRVNC